VDSHPKEHFLARSTRFLGRFRPAFLVVLLTALAAPGLTIARPPREHRVTELVSKLPAGIADTGVCGAQRKGCEIEVAPEGDRVLFSIKDGPLLDWRNGRVRIVSVGPLGTGLVGVNCYPFSDKCPFNLSEDGSDVEFATPTALVPEDTDARTDLYLRTGRATLLVSTDPDSSGSARWPSFRAMTADARRVFYAIYSLGSGGQVPWLYEWTRRTGEATRFPSDAKPAEYPEIVKILSRDGRHVLFATASSLVPEDTDSASDLYERTADGRVLLLTGRAGLTSQEGADVLRISSNGRRLLFATTDALVPEDTDTCTVNGVTRGCTDIYERTYAGRFRLVSSTPAGDGGSSDVRFQDASPDWDRVFFSTADGLLPEDVNEVSDLYLRSGDSLRLLAYTLAGRAVEGRFILTADGSRLFFETRKPLVPEDQDDLIYLDPNGDLFDYSQYHGQDVYEWSNGTFTLVSTGPGQPRNAKDADLLDVSRNGRYVTFKTELRLLPEDTDDDYDTYVRDTRTRETTLVSTESLPGGASPLTDGPRIIFHSSLPLVPEDQDRCVRLGNPVTCDDIYEQFDGRLTLVSTGPTDDGSNCTLVEERFGCPSFIGASPDGARVFFQTVSTLTPDDTDGGLNDVYVSRVVRGR
jgi:hypothetical protein